MKTCLNGNIFTTPFASNDVKVKVSGGFATISQKQELTTLTVLIGDDKIKTGSIVWVPAESCKLPFANKLYKVENMEGIFVPAQSVMIVEPPKAPPEATTASLSVLRPVYD